VPRDTTFAKINIAAKELAMEESDLRDVYERITGKRSLRDMTLKQREAVLNDFKSRGFVVKKNGKAVNGSGYSTKPYVRLIHALWGSCKKRGVIEDGSAKALRAFIAGQTEKHGARIDDVEFLTYGQATPIIETLKAMERRGTGKKK